MSSLTFHPWKLPKLQTMTKFVAGQGRRRGAVNMTVTVDGLQGDADANFQLMGPMDIASVVASAIVRVSPVASDAGAETTKFAHVDFQTADFPWRYTLDDQSADQIRPWLMLLVGTHEELQVVAGQANILSDDVLKDVPLKDSGLWAHFQESDQWERGRVICPRMPANTKSQYTAVLVPTYNEVGEPSWPLRDGTFPKSLRALHSWQFQTTEAGDFESLAAALRP
jgi:hypothetical protein